LQPASPLVYLVAPAPRFHPTTGDLLVLNLSGLQYLDSSGIGELARIYVSAVKVGGQMKVVGLSRKVEEVFKITQLHQVFPEFPSEEAALQSFPESSHSGII
jgi:anti-anti-sigma factor